MSFLRALRAYIGLGPDDEIEDRYLAELNARRRQLALDEIHPDGSPEPDFRVDDEYDDDGFDHELDEGAALDDVTFGDRRPLADPDDDVVRARRARAPVAGAARPAARRGRGGPADGEVRGGRARGL